MTPFLVATLLALVVVGGLALLYQRGDRRRFRQALVGAVVFVLLATAYVTWVAGGKLDRIDAAEVALADLRMVEAAGSFRLEGRVVNRSATYTIASVPVRLVVEDCGSEAAGNCRTVYDDSAEVMVSVPPGGSTEFRRIYTASASAVHGSRHWHAEAGRPRAYAADPR